MSADYRMSRDPDLTIIHNRVEIRIPTGTISLSLSPCDQTEVKVLLGSRAALVAEVEAAATKKSSQQISDLEGQVQLQAS